MAEQRIDYDGPWKEALEHYFEAFMAFFFAQAYADIDWAKGYEFLDKELQQVVREAELKQRRVDKLVKVWRRSGEETWVLIHIEVQGQVDPDFARRMYVYNYRLFDRYNRWVVSLAVLADEQANWRPQSYGYELWDCQVRLRFPIVKLLDYQMKWAVLEQSDNPFTVIVMAHLQAQATRRDPNERLEWKLSLVKKLYERGYGRKDILELFRFIDWVMVLPEELERQFELTLLEYEEEKKMQYITSIERSGIQKGLQQGIEQGIEQGLLKKAREDVIEVLTIRFERVPEALIKVIDEVNDSSVLKTLLKQAVTSESLAEFQTMVEAELASQAAQATSAGTSEN